MAAYEALYRKWRPQTFDDIVAQPHITRTLKNQIMREKTAHAYLFVGSRGTGKTTCARIFAKAVNCLHPKDGNPCLECENCRDAEKGALTDIIEIDGASNNGVGEVRSLRDNAAYMPVRCKYKVYVIDEAHMITTEAFNALLKMIEEPPPYVKFVLATTEIHKVPATILSRCQRFDFRRILPEDIAARIQYIASHESFTVSDAAAHRIAMLSDGGLRDALSLLDQCAAVSDTIESETVEEAVGVAGTESVYTVLHAVAARDAAAALSVIDKLYRQSKDMTRFADEISQQLRNVMLLKSAPDAPELISAMPQELDALKSLSEEYTTGGVLNALNAVRQCCDRMTRAGNRRMELEMTLIRLCVDLQTQTPTAQAGGDTAVLTDRIARLEAQLSELVRNGVPANFRAGAAQTAHRPEPKIPARELQVEGKPDTSQSTPVRNWAEVLERFHALNPAVSGLLQDSEAYALEDKQILLLIVRNRLFKQLFTRRDAAALEQAALQVLGKQYSIRFKTVEPQGEQQSPVDTLMQRAQEMQVPVGTREDKK